MADMQLKMWLKTDIGKAIAFHIASGLKVFPLHGIKDDLSCTCGANPCGKENRNAGKHPYTPTAPQGFKNATGVLDIAAEMFEYRTDLNVGVATGEESGILVIDVDNKNDGEGEKSLCRLQEVLGMLPPTVRLTTGNGYHLVFDYPVGSGLTISANSFGEGYPDIDMRGNGGYIVIYPSRHFTGRYYLPDPDSSGLADLPKMYIDLLKADRTPKKKEALNVDRHQRSGNHSEWSEEEIDRMLDYIVDIVDDYDSWIAVGMALHKEGCPMDMWDKWSSRGFKYAGINDVNTHWRSFNAGGDRTIGTVVELATLRGWRPVPEEYYRMPNEQAEEAVAPLVKKMLAKMRGETEIEAASARILAMPMGLSIPATPKKKREKKEEPEKEGYIPQFCFDPLQLSGGLGETIRWINRYAMFPQPELAMLNVLAFAGAVFGRRYMTPRNTRSNIYLVATARTGGGKGHSRQMINRLSLESGLSNYMGGNSIRSDTGMLRGLMTNSSQLLQLDEFGLMMQALSDKGAPHHVKAIIRALMSLYSDSNGAYHHGDYADEKAKPIKIAFPNLCIYGTTTEDSYIPALKRSAIKSGELNRFVVIPSRDVPEPNFKAPPIESNPELVEWWKSFAPGIGSSLGAILNNANSVPKVTLVEWGDCDEMQEQLLRDQVEICNSDRPLRDLWSRLYENTLKIAMIFSIARDPDAPEFVQSDIEYGRSIIEASINYMESLAENNIMETPQEQNHHEVHQAIIDSGADGITRSKLLRKFRKFRKKDIDDLVGTMVEEGVVLPDRKMNGGRPLTVYYALTEQAASAAAE